MASPDMPQDGYIFDSEKSAKIVKLSQTNVNAFKLVIAKTITAHPDQFNLLQLNDNSDATDTTMDKASFAKRFESAMREELLHVLFDCIDINNKGVISNAALLSFTHNKPMHPAKQTTQINSKWLFTTIKKMNFGELATGDNQVSFEEMKDHFADKNVSDEIVQLVFDEIDSDKKGYISMKDFFQWRDRFDPAKLRTWSHTLSATMVFTGMEEFMQEMSEMNESEEYEMIDSNNAQQTHSDSKTNDSETFEEIDHDTTLNQETLLKDIVSILDEGFDDKQQTTELTKIIKKSVEKLKFELAEARLADISDKNKIKQTNETVQKLEYESAEQQLATQQLCNELTNIIGRTIKTDNVSDLIIIIKELQSIISDERLETIQAQKDMQLKIEQYDSATNRLNYKLSEARLALTKLKKDLSETLGTHEASAEDPHELTELFKRLQHQIAEERMDNIRQRRASVQLKDNLDQVNYQLADERIQLLELKETVTNILDINLDELNDIEEMKQMMRRLQAHVNIDPSDTKRVLRNKSEQAQLAKADETIKKVDMEVSIATMAQDEDEEDVHAIEDPNKLKKIIKSLKGELRNSRTDQLAVSETKTHLEVQTFDLQTKLVTEKQKYNKLLRMSQNLGGFDPSMLEQRGDVAEMDAIEEATLDLAASVQAAQDQYQPNSDDPEEEEEEDHYNDNADDDESDGGDSVNINDEAVHKEEYIENKKSTEQLENIIAKLKAKIKEQYDSLKRYERENAEMTEQNDKLRTRNRNHRRRESEVFTAIGDNAKNTVEAFEELEESRKKIENDDLELQYLKAETQRMAIAYDHAKENASKYRKQATDLKKQVQSMESSTRKRTASRADELNSAKSRLTNLEQKAKDHENLELELAFYKAEKQRMEVKMDFQERTKKQVKELNKELQKAVKTEKDKVRRLSQTFNVKDIDELNNLPQVQAAKEDEWKSEVDKLKEELANEQMEKTVLKKEKNDLIQKLQTAESTQRQTLHRESDEDVEEEEESSEEDDGNASPLSGDNIDDDDDYHKPAGNDVETLKFKLANAELQNAQLKRRVSIAGIEKEALSLLWDKPRVTIQMVSEFIERLPLKHKEKIWARHATGQYIAKNKILHTLHSFVALCIKIKDRTAVAPSRHDIEKKLVPFADVIRQRTENANGMSLDEFNNELHYWILEPVSGLIMTNDEQKQWLDEIDVLRDELMKAQEAKRRIERKSQMDLTVLLDKMKELEQNPEQELEELEEQIEELHGIVNELQDEVKANEVEIKRLNEENGALRQGRDKARESEDDEEEEEVVPELIDSSQQKPLSEYREMQTEDEFQEERLEFSRNDSGVTKSTAYVGWKNKAARAEKKVEQLERERTQTTEQVGSLQKTLDALRASKKAESTTHETQIEQFKSEIAKFKKKYQESDRIRKDSISTLHDNLFAKLLEAEAEHEEMVADYKQQIGRLQKANKAFEESMKAMANKKVDTIKELATTVQQLRKTVTGLAKLNEILTTRIDELESRSAVQHIMSNWIG